jgi:hypothetical protein
MKPPRPLLLVCAFVAAAVRAEDRAPAPAPPAEDREQKTEAGAQKTESAEPKPADHTPAAPAAAATPPAAAPAAAPAAQPAADGTNSVLSKLKLPLTPAQMKEGIKPPPLPPRFKQVRDRIDDLFALRNAPPPPVDPAKNPFRPPGAVVLAAGARDGDTPPVAIPVSSDLALLQQAAAQLRISGFVELKERLHVTINQSLYKEGDVIKVALKGQTLFLRVTKISRGNLTLALNDAEMTLRF